MPSVKSIAKGLYAALPFKQPLFNVLRWLGPPPERIYRHLHFMGTITVKVSPSEQFKLRHYGYMIENELFWSGLDGWEKVSMELWTRLCRRSQVIVDIGANTGIYALVAQTANPSARVIAVEPVKRIHEKLQENVALNGGHVIAVHAAASDHSGKAILYDLPDREHVLSVSLEAQWNNESPELTPVEVPCTTVADLLQQHGASTVDLLKIDVETHEAAVLRGFLDVLRRDKPTLLIEILNDQVANEVSALLDGLGYGYYNIDDVTWPPVKTDQLSKSRHFNFLVCQPEVAKAIGL
jgi:FkbM family methyltransferase